MPWKVRLLHKNFSLFLPLGQVRRDAHKRSFRCNGRRLSIKQTPEKSSHTFRHTRLASHHGGVGEPAVRGHHVGDLASRTHTHFRQTQLCLKRLNVKTDISTLFQFGCRWLLPNSILKVFQLFFCDIAPDKKHIILKFCLCTAKYRTEKVYKLVLTTYLLYSIIYLIFLCCLFPCV